MCPVKAGSHSVKATTNRTYPKTNCQSGQNPVEKEKKKEKRKPIPKRYALKRKRNKCFMKNV